MKLQHKLRRGYMFGYGSGRGEDMIIAVTGEKPKMLGTAILKGYELRIQDLREVTTVGPNPQKILQRSWGESFKSYTIAPKQGAQVEGTLFRLTNKARHKIDAWELIDMGWYDKAFVSVEVAGRKIRAETQVLGAGQSAKMVAGKKYRQWIQPKAKFLALARSIRSK